MNVTDLFTVRTPTEDAAIPLGESQRRFLLDPQRRQIVEGWRRMFGAHLVLRVQTRRRWQWRGLLVLNDRSTDQLRALPFLAQVQGIIADTEEAARKALDAMLPSWRGKDASGGFDPQARIQALLDDAVFAWGQDTASCFIRGFREKGLEPFQNGLRQALGEAGLTVEHVALQPRSFDRSVPGRCEDTIDFTDEGRPLAVRDPLLLAERRIGYNVRLRWSRTVAGDVGRYGYEGTVFGQSAGPVLSAPAVNGQVQPLGFWLRRLLEAALPRENWAKDPANPLASDALVESVSGDLRRGTGREIETLRLFAADDPSKLRLGSGTLNFPGTYRIFGVQNDEPLVIEHQVVWRIGDGVRWANTREDKVETFLQRLIEDETRHFLHGKRFDDIVTLYVDDDSQLGKAIEPLVCAKAKAAGIDIEGPIGTVLSLRESEFVKGKRILLPEQPYDMRADFNHRPIFSVRADVMLCAEEGGGRLFAKSVGSGAGFEQRVQSVMADAIRDVLGSQISAADFYNSLYQLRDPVEDADGIRPPDAHAMLCEEVDKRLKELLGLQVRRFDLVRSAQDKVAERLHEMLDRNHIDVHYVETRGVEPHTTTVLFELDLRIRGFTGGSWSSFHARVGRSLEDHLDEVRASARVVLQRAALGLPRKDRIDALKQGVEQRSLGVEVVRQIAKDCGLCVDLQRLNVTVQRTVTDQITALELQSLHNEFLMLSGRLVKMADNDALTVGMETREEIRARMNDIKREIAVVRQQAATDIDTQAGDMFVQPGPVALLPSGALDRDTQRLLGDGGQRPPTIA